MTFRRLGIAGYMGAGKSVAARLLAAQADAVIVDADHEAKTLMAGDQGVRQKLVLAFGGSIIGKDGLSFAALGQIVFSSREKLLLLNTIVHPLLVQRLRRMLFGPRNNRNSILDAALLPLWNIESWFDACLWIHAPAEIRLERLRQTRGDLDEHALRDRMRMQEESLRAPGSPPWRLLANDGSMERLAERLAQEPLAQETLAKKRSSAERGE
jgi:dephospho-CoA kinase